MFYDDWVGLARVLIVGSVAYASLVLFLRVTGKRTLTKLNAFDLVVTIALGSTLATVMLSEEVALAEGLLALALLVGLQFVVTWISVRVPSFLRLVKAEPTLLCYRGQLLEEALLAERVTAEEVRAAVRSEGLAEVEAVEAVVLETDGTLSVLTRGKTGSALQDVARRRAPKTAAM